MAQALADGTSSNGVESVETRLARLEQKMEQVLTMATTSAHQKSQEDPLSRATPLLPQQSPYLAEFDSILLDNANEILGHPHSNLPQPQGLVTSATSDDIPSSSYPQLPALIEIQPAIDHYFTHVV